MRCVHVSHDYANMAHTPIWRIVLVIGTGWPDRSGASPGQGQDQTMTNHPQRTAISAAKRTAQAAGIYIREGSYQGTTDDRLGRWYLGRDGEPFRPWGSGYRTQGEAWLAAVDMLSV
jgi:hypothetical protein